MRLRLEDGAEKGDGEDEHGVWGGGVVGVPLMPQAVTTHRNNACFGFPCRDFFAQANKRRRLSTPPFVRAP